MKLGKYQLRGAAIAAAAALATALIVAFSYAPAPEPLEVGIFLGTSDRSWKDFEIAVDLAAGEKGLPFSIDSSKHECVVHFDQQPVVFRWYPEAGSRNIQYRVRQLCQRPSPPIALVGANNSAMTHALVSELRRHGDNAKAPALLMTVGTADFLIDKQTGRSFRFGFNNSYQARVVVDRLGEFYRRRGLADPKLNVVLVQVLDDPFSLDLSRNFRDELAPRFDADFVKPPSALTAPTYFEDRPVSFTSAENAWSLKTCTGSFNVPNEDERKLAEGLVQGMAANPDRQWAVVLPVGTHSFRRLSSAIATAFQEHPDAQRAERARQNLVILSGDSMNYYTFAEPDRSFLDPDRTPAPVILFAHVDPVDPSMSSPPNHVPSRSLNRDVARAVLHVLSDPANRAGPEAFAKALEHYKPESSDVPFFTNYERRTGGGAIVAIPERDRFEILLPRDWQ